MKLDAEKRQQELDAQNRLTEWRQIYRQTIHRGVLKAGNDAGSKESGASFMPDPSFDPELRYTIRRNDHRATNGFLKFGLSTEGLVYPSSSLKGQPRPWGAVDLKSATEEWAADIAYNVLADELQS